MNLYHVVLNNGLDYYVTADSEDDARYIAVAEGIDHWLENEMDDEDCDLCLEQPDPIAFALEHEHGVVNWMLHSVELITERFKPRSNATDASLRAYWKKKAVLIRTMNHAK